MSVDLTAGAARGRADRLLEPRARGVLFASLLIWRLGEASRQPGQRLLLAAFALTACWAWLTRGRCPATRSSALPKARATSSGSGCSTACRRRSDERQHGVRLVYGAVAAVIGMQLVADVLLGAASRPAPTRSRRPSLILRITTAAGALVLVHNLYGQAAPASRSHIRLAMLGLAWMWGYDLNLYTVAYLGSATAPEPVRLARPGRCADRAAVRARRARTSRAGASACRAPRPSSRSRCSRSAPISR